MESYVTKLHSPQSISLDELSLNSLTAPLSWVRAFIHRLTAIPD